MSSALPIAVQPLYVSIPEAATMAGISRSFIYEVLATNGIRSIKVGRRRLVEVESIKQWQASFAANEGLQGPVVNGGGRC